MNRIYFNRLFDYYQNLLTKKEQDIFKDHYEEDLSLQEIADNLTISKAAVGKTIKKVEKKLVDYESKLQLNGHNKIINELLKNEIDNQLLEKINEYI